MAAMRLAGKVAIITGAASGIGRATAVRFASEGAAVVLADVDEPALTAVATEIAARGARVATLRTDVTRAADCARLVEHAESRFQRLDVAFANAGTIVVHDLLATTEAEWDRVLAVNLKGAFLLAQAAMPAFRRAGGGVFLSTGSGVGLVPRPGYPAYVAAKAGVIALTKAIALEYAAWGVRAVCICPGAVDTPMHRRVESRAADPAEARRRTAEAYPLGRVADPEEIANAALFLASDAASYITGIAFPVDGGRTLY